LEKIPLEYGDHLEASTAIDTGYLSQADLRADVDPEETSVCPLILKEDFVQVLTAQLEKSDLAVYG